MDSLSAVPICMIYFAVLLAGPRPYKTSLALIAGMFVSYLVLAFAIILGLQNLLDQVTEFTSRLWQTPETEEIILQIVIGVFLSLLGYRSYKFRNKVGKKIEVREPSTSQAFLNGGLLMILGIPGAFPLFAAIDFILRADLDNTKTMGMLVYYVCVFVTPLLALVGLNDLFGRHSQKMMAKINQFIDRWWQRSVIVVLFLLGAVLIVDGVGWLYGTPLIPI